MSAMELSQACSALPRIGRCAGLTGLIGDKCLDQAAECNDDAGSIALAPPGLPAKWDRAQQPGEQNLMSICVPSVAARPARRVRPGPEHGEGAAEGGAGGGHRERLVDACPAPARHAEDTRPEPPGGEHRGGCALGALHRRQGAVQAQSFFFAIFVLFFLIGSILTKCGKPTHRTLGIELGRMSQSPDGQGCMELVCRLLHCC